MHLLLLWPSGAGGGWLACVQKEMRPRGGGWKHVASGKGCVAERLLTVDVIADDPHAVQCGVRHKAVIARLLDGLHLIHVAAAQAVHGMVGLAQGERISQRYALSRFLFNKHFKNYPNTGMRGIKF